MGIWEVSCDDTIVIMTSESEEFPVECGAAPLGQKPCAVFGIRNEHDCQKVKIKFRIHCMEKKTDKKCHQYTNHTRK